MSEDLSRLVSVQKLLSDISTFMLLPQSVSLCTFVSYLDRAEVEAGIVFEKAILFIIIVIKIAEVIRITTIKFRNAFFFSSSYIKEISTGKTN